MDMDKFLKCCEKVGGRYRLTVLMQKRLKELKRGEKPLVDMASNNATLEDIILEEILQNKIYLALEEEIIEKGSK